MKINSKLIHRTRQLKELWIPKENRKEIIEKSSGCLEWLFGLTDSIDFKIKYLLNNEVRGLRAYSEIRGGIYNYFNSFPFIN